MLGNCMCRENKNPENITLLSVNAPFSNDSVDFDVPGLGLELLRFLKVVGDAYQQRASKIMVAIVAGKSSIVKATAHTQTIEFGVERYQRHQDNVQVYPVHQRLAGAQGFRYAKGIHGKAAVRCHGCKHQRAGAVSPHNGQVTQFVLRDGNGCNSHCVHFAIIGDIQSDTVRSFERSEVFDLCNQFLRCGKLLSFREVTATGTHISAQLLSTDSVGHIERNVRNLSSWMGDTLQIAVASL